MAKGSGGGGKPGRSGGGNGGPTLQSAIDSGEISAQRLPGNSTQLTHAKATVRYSPNGAEVWSSRTGEKAFKPVAPVKTYKDRLEGVREFARRTGITL